MPIVRRHRGRRRVEEESLSACLHELIREENPLNKTVFYPEEDPELILAKGLKAWTHPV